jgi:hypothetical protein
MKAKKADTAGRFSYQKRRFSYPIPPPFHRQKFILVFIYSSLCVFPSKAEIKGGGVKIRTFLKG